MSNECNGTANRTYRGGEESFRGFTITNIADKSWSDVQSKMFFSPGRAFEGGGGQETGKEAEKDAQS